MKSKVQELEKIRKDLEKFVEGYCEAFPGKSSDYVGESCGDAAGMIQDTITKLKEEIDKGDNGS